MCTLDSQHFYALHQVLYHLKTFIIPRLTHKHCLNLFLAGFVKMRNTITSSLVYTNTIALDQLLFSVNAIKYY